MIILGLDPGTAITGYAIIEQDDGNLTALHYGVTQTSPDQPTPLRLKIIYDQIIQLIDRYNPDVLVTERILFSKNERTAFQVGRAIGVALLAAAQHKLEWHEFTPAEVKLAVVGFGNAEKHQVQLMVQRILSLKSVPEPDDAADALAVSICFAHSNKLRALGVGR
ncbi:MAG: crossover junction endodeoxyribonuclease RuvC [Armatimonadetes bacterium]|nr:crossover junction endodeoxyribonuclease RuvC [Armatimonadota bacterium]